MPNQNIGEFDLPHRGFERARGIANEADRQIPHEADRQIPQGERWDVAVVREPAPWAGRNIRWAREFDAMFQAEEEKAGKTQGKRGEELFQLILSGIREIYDVEAVIAGGAVRDLAAGVADHKDVDVFIPIAVDKFQFSLDELGWQGPFKLAGKGNKYPIVEGKKEVGCMFPTTARASHRVQGCPVDLVFTAYPIGPNEVGTFPVHAQRCVWQLGRGLVLSPEAKTDIDNKTFTIDSTITDKEKIKLVLDKAKGWQKREGYGDWKIVEPDVKEWWEAKEEIAKADEEEKKKKEEGSRLVKYGSVEYWQAYWNGKADPVAAADAKGMIRIYA